MVSLLISMRPAIVMQRYALTSIKQKKMTCHRAKYHRLKTYQKIWLLPILFFNNKRAAKSQSPKRGLNQKKLRWVTLSFKKQFLLNLLTRLNPKLKPIRQTWHRQRIFSVKWPKRMLPKIRIWRFKMKTIALGTHANPNPKNRSYQLLRTVHSKGLTVFCVQWTRSHAKRRSLISIFTFSA